MNAHRSRWRRAGVMAGALLVLFAAYTSSEERAHWVPFVALPGVVDLTATRRDGRLTATAAGRLFLVAPAGTLEPFAREPGGYAGNPGFEAYLALAHGRHVRGARCAFRRDDVYVLDVMVPYQEHVLPMIPGGMTVKDIIKA